MPSKLRRGCLSWAILFLSAGLTPVVADVTVQPMEDKITVNIDGELFTEYHYKDCENPYLYPILGPHGIRMTRDYPMLTRESECTTTRITVRCGLLKMA